MLRSTSSRHRQALRAAAGAALFGGSLACAEVEPTPLSSQLPTPSPAEAFPVRDASVADFQSGLDIGAAVVRSTDLAFPTGSDAGVADAGWCEVGPNYVECCQAAGWNPAVGCAAWGPPAPPAFGPERQARA